MAENASMRKWSVESGKAFRKALLHWYDKSKRDLPWRKDHDPYHVWISEIMLQQTRVAAVIGYYAKFLERFPDVQRLARAREASVLAAWSGLGYYRRARAMHATARLIVRERGGEFPRATHDWERLPGIGRYTAAAIASIAFGEGCAVVDGNVERVVGRLTGANQLTREAVWDIAGEMLDTNRPGDFNQAMMEVGATICMPVQPNCGKCPVAIFCVTRGPSVSAQKQVRKRGEAAFLLSTQADTVLLVRRAASNSLMPGMWELPSAKNGQSEDAAFTLRHSITDTDYTVRVWRGEAPAHPQGRWVRVAQLERTALTGLTRKILRRAGII
jgi:A/G-specific adenine glycosylase